MKTVKFNREFEVTQKGMTLNRITPKDGYKFISHRDIVYVFISSANSHDWNPTKRFPRDEKTKSKWHSRALEVLQEHGIENPFESKNREQAILGLLPDYVVLFYAGEEIVLHQRTGESISHGDRFLYNDEWQEFLSKI